MIPEYLHVKIANFDMAPNDWGMLDKLVEPHTYLIIVREYYAQEQKRFLTAGAFSDYVTIMTMEGVAARTPAS